MSFCKRLKAILKTKENIFGYEIQITSSNQDKKSDLKFKIDNGSKRVIIYLDKLTISQDKNLKFALKEYFVDEELFFISESSEPLLERLYKYRGNKDITKTANFFKNILSNKDWEALRASLYLRAEFNDKKNISLLKKDIIMRFGERGNTISNLCTAGYFEEVMIPLFNSSRDDFHSYWDIAIDRGITALFVNNKMTISKIATEIKQKIKSAKLYGLQSFHIHGIGSRNTKKIISCLEIEKANLDFVDKKVFNKNGVMVVEIIL